VGHGAKRNALAAGPTAIPKNSHGVNSARREAAYLNADDDDTHNDDDADQDADSPWDSDGERDAMHRSAAGKVQKKSPAARKLLADETALEAETQNLKQRVPKAVAEPDKLMVDAADDDGDSWDDEEEDQVSGAVTIEVATVPAPLTPAAKQAPAVVIASPSGFLRGQQDEEERLRKMEDDMRQRIREKKVAKERDEQQQQQTQVTVAASAVVFVPVVAATATPAPAISATPGANSEDSDLKDDNDDDEVPALIVRAKTSPTKPHPATTSPPAPVLPLAAKQPVENLATAETARLQAETQQQQAHQKAIATEVARLEAEKQQQAAAAILNAQQQQQQVAAETARLEAEKQQQQVAVLKVQQQQTAAEVARLEAEKQQQAAVLKAQQQAAEKQLAATAAAQRQQETTLQVLQAQIDAAKQQQEQQQHLTQQTHKQQQERLAVEARALEQKRADMEQTRQQWFAEQQQAAKQKAELELQVRAQQQMLVEAQQQHALLLEEQQQKLEQLHAAQSQTHPAHTPIDHDDNDADTDFDDVTFDENDTASGPVTPRAKPNSSVFAVTPRSAAKRDVHAELAQEREARLAAEEELQRLRLARTGEVGELF
jgi:hypothetical protein